MKFFSLGITIFCAQLAGAQATPAVPNATVSGVVRDSISKKVLARADVQLVAANDPGRIVTTASDSLGRFTFRDVRDGSYTLGFLHPILDSLGLEPPLRSVTVDGGRPVRIDIGIPSAAQLRSKICGKMAGADTSALIVGIVRNARDATPVENAKVSAEWLEFTFKKNDIQRHVARIAASSGENGWFAMCNVPSNGTIAMQVSRGADSTGLAEVKVPSDGFMRRDLYLGSSRIGAASHAGDSTGEMKVVRYGDGRVTGKVIAEDGRRPISGAIVGITEGPQTRTNERGEWILGDAPTGTRMLEVHALGFYPEARRVDVVVGAEPVIVAMSTLKHVLDTVRISATRLGFNRDSQGFLQRSRSGMGHYLTQRDISQRFPVVTSDLFKTVSGMRVLEDGPYGRRILMRGPFDYCEPALFIDGREMTVMTMTDLDGFINPEHIKGIEIYTGATAPPEFQPGLSGCGSIVIWTR